MKSEIYSKSIIYLNSETIMIMIMLKKLFVYELLFQQEIFFLSEERYQHVTITNASKEIKQRNSVSTETIQQTSVESTVNTDSSLTYSLTDILTS